MKIEFLHFSQQLHSYTRNKIDISSEWHLQPLIWSTVEFKDEAVYQPHRPMLVAGQPTYWGTDY